MTKKIRLMEMVIVLYINDLIGDNLKESLLEKIEKKFKEE